MRLHLPGGTAAADGFNCVVEPDGTDWRHTSLRIMTLRPGGAITFATGAQEMVVLPLAGGAAVRCDDQEFRLAGRDGVFEAVSDFGYLPREADVEVRSERGGRFAVIGAVCTNRLTPRHGRAQDVPVELRGAGSASRQVNNFCTPASFEADRLIAVEVLTPGGNWSSWPPHKHDEYRPGLESVLEEIYYFELSRPGGMAWMRAYDSRRGPIEVCAQVGDGDVVLIPHGWHGPAAIAPGADLYYLNVMAGPGAERAWRICDDPTHAAVRADWSGVELDSRLPMTSAAGRVTP